MQDRTETSRDMDAGQNSTVSAVGYAGSEATGGDDGLLIVGIGASAGGLEALESLFCNMAVDSGMAFVVIQHLSPDFKSLMDELLARHTEIKIRVVENGMLVEANTIYLMPPRKEMRIKDSKLLLADKDVSQGLSLPIDVFFQSMAEDCGGRAVAVVLSGSGSDGSRGVVAIHAAGGLVLVQQADTAKFDSMPNAAIETMSANFVVPPEKMNEVLLQHAEHPFRPDTTPGLRVFAEEGEFAEIFALLLDQYGIDFTHYKPTTVMRRIHRRVELSGSRNIDEFISRLTNDAAELNLMYKDLLMASLTFSETAMPLTV